MTSLSLSVKRRCAKSENLPTQKSYSIYIPTMLYWILLNFKIFENSRFYWILNVQVLSSQSKDNSNNDKSVFSLVRRLSTWHCPHLLLSAVLRRRCCWARLQLVHGAAVDLYLLPARRSAVNPPAIVAAVDRWETDRRTDRRTLDRYIDPATHTVRAASVITSCRRRQQSQ